MSEQRVPVLVQCRPTDAPNSLHHATAKSSRQKCEPAAAACSCRSFPPVASSSRSMSRRRRGRRGPKDRPLSLSLFARSMQEEEEAQGKHSPLQAAIDGGLLAAERRARGGVREAHATDGGLPTYVPPTSRQPRVLRRASFHGLSCCPPPSPLSLSGTHSILLRRNATHATLLLRRPVAVRFRESRGEDIMASSSSSSSPSRGYHHHHQRLIGKRLGGGGGHASPLNRRWSLDNLDSAAGPFDAREGYIRDIRQQSSLASIRDEEYPFMATDADSGAVVVPAAVASSSRCVNFVRLFLHDLNRLPFKTLLAQTRSGPRAADEPGGGGAAPGRCRRLVRLGQQGGLVVAQVAASTVRPAALLLVRRHLRRAGRHRGRLRLLRADKGREPRAAGGQGKNAPIAVEASKRPPSLLQIGVGKAFLRQRSSSLPRILPPILDGDDSTAGAEDSSDPSSLQQLQQDRQSNVVVREMQKFVCRQATDVSHLLPLPLPTNSRQGKTAIILCIHNPYRTRA